MRVNGVGKNSIQGDAAFALELEKIGAQVRWGEDFIEVSRPAGQAVRAFDIDANHIPDAAMTLAVVALAADGSSTLRNIASWRVKETDRIAAMAAELRKLGANGGRRGGFYPHHATGQTKCRRADRHLRRPPHGHVLLAGQPARCAGADSRSESAPTKPFPVILTSSTACKLPEKQNGRRLLPAAVCFAFCLACALFGTLPCLGALRGGSVSTAAAFSGCP